MLVDNFYRFNDSTLLEKKRKAKKNLFPVMEGESDLLLDEEKGGNEY